MLLRTISAVKTLRQDIQNLDLQDYLGYTQPKAKEALLEIFQRSLAASDELDRLAEDVSQR